MASKGGLISEGIFTLVQKKMRNQFENTFLDFVQLVRSTLKRIKDDPYTAVTIFHTNSPRY